MIKLVYNFRLISKDNERILGKNNRMYFLSKKFRDWENKVKQETILQYAEKPLKNDLSIIVCAYFTSKVHADATNLFKGICDALQGEVYLNDRQIKEAKIIVVENSKNDMFAVCIGDVNEPLH